MELDLKKCVGCGSCYSICPKKSIAMEADSEGFLYPRINMSTCVDCHLCEAHCPTSDIIKKEKYEKAAYACYTNDEAVRHESSSGGIFTQISKFVLDNGGIIFGAAFSDDFTIVKHISVDNVKELSKLRGSKYVQSDIGNTYREVEKYLKGNRLVFFTGTPCEVAGLNKYLNKKYDNLLTQDFICHGVPSAFAWKRYVEYIENINNSSVCEVSFRNKKYGWRNFSILIQFKNNTQYCQKYFDDIYMQGFLNNMYLRYSCYDCIFKSGNSNSDITVADFWGIGRVLPEIDDDMGISAVIINTEKGEKVFEYIKEKIVYRKVQLETIEKTNPAYNESVEMPYVRKKIFRDIRQYSFDKAMKKNSQPSLEQKIILRLKHIWRNL